MEEDAQKEERLVKMMKMNEGAITVKRVLRNPQRI